MCNHKHNVTKPEVCLLFLVVVKLELVRSLFFINAIFITDIETGIYQYLCIFVSVFFIILFYVNKKHSWEQTIKSSQCFCCI